MSGLKAYSQISRGVGRILKVGRLWVWEWVGPNIIKLSRMQLVVVQWNYSCRE